MFSNSSVLEYFYSSRSKGFEVFVTGECLDDGMDHAKAFRPIICLLPLLSICKTILRDRGGRDGVRLARVIGDAYELSERGSRNYAPCGAPDRLCIWGR